MKRRITWVTMSCVGRRMNETAIKLVDELDDTAGDQIRLRVLHATPSR